MNFARKLAAEQPQCELFGLFGLIVQGILFVLSVMSLVVKKFLPAEKRTWNVFCLDIWKQLLTSGFGHFLNLFLSIYLEQITGSGNGCVWYLMNLVMDLVFGLAISYFLYNIIDHYAVKYNIEVLKSGVYMDESVNMLDTENTDKHLNYRIWMVQMVVWCMIVFLSKIVVFFIEILYYKPLAAIGDHALQPFEGYPQT